MPRTSPLAGVDNGGRERFGRWGARTLVTDPRHGLWGSPAARMAGGLFPYHRAGLPSLSPARAGKWELSDIPGLLFSSFWEKANET